ncbi:MAG: SUMF1/EgtB/PvdO family nonheme iron enzyme [Planctomycetota bacterium]
MSSKRSKGKSRRTALPKTVRNPPTRDAAGKETGASKRDRYRLGKEIGRGGLGRVVEAADAPIGRTVALKLLLEGAPLDFVERFHREGRITGRLEHPNIVPVHEVGALPATGEVFIAMKRITGRDMADVIADLRRGKPGEWTQRRLVEALRDACRAVAYAHSKGVIHRDLKPSNVMLGEFGEVLVVDWGLAKDLHEKETAAGSGCGESAGPLLTLDGDVFGTPEYMPPEQAAGRVDDIDERSDVYSLGAILYEILAWRPPRVGESTSEILSRAASEPVRAPSTFVGLPGLPRSTGRRPGAQPPPVPADLEAVCMRALALDPAARYASATELGRDIDRWLEGAAEKARRRNAALQFAERGLQQTERLQRLDADLARAEGRAEALFETVKPFEAVERKLPLWEAQEKVKALQQERLDAFSAALGQFQHALAEDPDCAAASNALAGLHMERLEAAQRRRDATEARLQRDSVLRHDRDGVYRAKLEAPGRLSVRVRALKCRCLEPVRGGEWNVEFSDETPVPWREGGPVEGEARDDDVTVPRISQRGGSFGHGPACEFVDVEGAQVGIAPYREVQKRLVTDGAERLEGCPVRGLELHPGSWRCVVRAPGFADATVPVLIERGRETGCVVTLYRADEIPGGFQYVPGGDFLYSGGAKERPARTRDFFVAALPVTVREYLDFLNDLCAKGKGEEAARRQPREEETRHLKRSGDGYAAGVSGESLLCDAEFPVAGVSWFDAVAYATWKSKRDGRLYRLLHEEEFEKAARGTDGRTYPWGHEYDGTFANTNVSHAEGGRLARCGAFESDVSPYGVRDLSGNMSAWCWNAPEKPYRHYRCIRGGAWYHSPTWAKCEERQGTVPTTCYRNYGFRLCLPTGV